MALITLNLRDLKSGQRMLAEFETVDSCVEWLEHRPQFIDVLGPVDDTLSREAEQMLKAALRPYDAEEKALMAEHSKRRQFEQERARAQEADALDRERAAFQSQVQTRGVNDAMQLKWTRHGSLTHTEPLDVRPIPPVVEAAVEAWVQERDAWVHRRGQRLSEAVVTVWPGELPEGSERVQPGGQFEVEPLDGG